MTEEGWSNAHLCPDPFQHTVLGRKGLRLKFARFLVSVPKAPGSVLLFSSSHNWREHTLFIASDLNEKEFC